VTESSIRTLSQESRELRLKLYELCKQGKNEEQALFELLPDDHDRFFRFLEWQEMGLWPPPEVDDLTEPIGPERVGQPRLVETGVLDLSKYAIPQAWLEMISGLIKATVNAAVLDYHSVQGDQIEALVTSLVDEKIASVLDRYKVTAADQAMQPEPPPILDVKHPGRRGGAKRPKLQGSCDHTLFERFEEDRKTRGFSVSEMIDFILFNYYGKPPLSFEKE